MSYKVRAMGLPEKCWIYSKKEYIFHGPKERRFPEVHGVYEPVLKKHGIPYKKGRFFLGSQYLEYWNPSFYEEEKITHPLFAFMSTDNMYCYVERDYTGQAPTQETYNKAWEINATVDKYIEEYIQKERMITFAKHCKERLNGENAVGIELSNLEASGFEDELNITFEGQRIKYIRFLRNRSTSFAVIFNVSRIEHNSELTMKVPIGKEGLFIGTSGYWAKYWAAMLGVKYIKIVS